MKSVLKVCNINSQKDISSIRQAVAKHEGVVACQISKEKGEISVVYDDYFVKVDEIIESVEDIGYTVL